MVIESLPKLIVFDPLPVAPTPITIWFDWLAACGLVELPINIESLEFVAPEVVPDIYEPAFPPNAILLSPLILKYNASLPIAVLLSPLILKYNASLPIAVLSLPVVFEYNTLSPIAVLEAPLILNLNESWPRAVLKLPLVFESNALTPIAVFS